MALMEQAHEQGTPYVPCTVEEAKGHIETYFRRFSRLRKWINESHEQILQYGFIYSFYGRKRRLRNFQSTDRGVQAGEVRSGFNAIIQSASSDSLLIGVMDADDEIQERGLDASIVGLVHDSVIAIVREDLVEEYEELLDRNIQSPKFNWDVSEGELGIPGCPIGIEADSEKGGSRDYSCGKLDKAFPHLAVLDGPEMQDLAKLTLEQFARGELDEPDPKSKIAAIIKNKELVLDTLQELGCSLVI